MQKIRDFFFSFSPVILQETELLFLFLSLPCFRQSIHAPTSNSPTTNNNSTDSKNSNNNNTIVNPL